MRHVYLASAIVAVCLVPASVYAQGNSEVSGFGGMTFGTSSFSGSVSSSTFGGRVAVGLGDNLQAVAEGGRMTDIKSPIFDLVQFTTPIGLRLSAWYGEGGVRFIASPRSAVRPYGEATAGFARLSTGVSGIDGPADFIANTGLAILSSTKPLLGAGAGVLLQGGPLSIDLGYRYKKILTGSSPLGVLDLGRDVSVNQIRVGVGVRF